MVDEKSKLIDLYPTGKSCSDYAKIRCIIVEATCLKSVRVTQSLRRMWMGRDFCGRYNRYMQVMIFKNQYYLFSC